MSTFAVVNEVTLSEAVGRCKARLAYIAPGITERVVDSVGAVLSREGSPAITLINDADPEVCRLGYGTMAGLEALQRLAAEHMVPVRYQPGLRVGLLVVDDEVLVFAPTPLLLEAGSNSPAQPNAIVLGKSASTEQVLRACAVDGGDASDMPLPSQAEIGRVAATPELLARSLAELKRLPPKPFDLARIERVYSAKLQYVEFEVSGYRLADRRVRIPNDLLVGDDKTLNSRLRNNFSLLENTSTLIVKIPDADPKSGEPMVKDGKAALVDYSEAAIERERKKIYDDFLTPVSGHGQLISKARREAFDLRVGWFVARVNAFKAGVKSQLDDAIGKSIDSLVDALLPTLEKRPPERLLKHSLSMAVSSDELRAALCVELRNAFEVGGNFYQPTVKVVFKDLTYETIKDEAFREQLRKRFPGVDQEGAGGLFEEHDAAPALG